MKRILFLYINYINLFIYFQAGAQMPISYPLSKNISKMSVIDSGNIKVWYALNAVDIEKHETYDDLQLLEAGDYLSKYYSYWVYCSDSLSTSWRQKHSNARSIPLAMGQLRDKKRKKKDWLEYQWSEYFKDFSANILTEYIRMPIHLHRNNSQYSEYLHPQQWEISDDTLTVIGYLCQKAECRFRGRNYTAWFAVDIPINNGPWKFGGLPGLILKLYDNDKLYTFECIGIERHKQKYPIMKYDHYKNMPKMDRKKILKLNAAVHENYFKATGFVITDIVNSDEEEAKDTEPPYYPLELE
jgi:GLPGLI family protein